MYKIVPGPYPLTLEVGYNKGLREITANKSGDSSVITRLYPYGATTNMPNGARLSILAVDAVDPVQVVDGIYIFEDIYPRITCVVTGVMNFNQIFTSGIGFTLANYIIPYNDPKITFLSGYLKGMEFVFTQTLYYSEWIYTLTPYELDGGITVPGSTEGYNIKPGDEFVIWNINMPQTYIDDAKTLLYEAAEAYLLQSSRQKLKLNVITDDLFFRRNNTYLYTGQTLNIKSSIVPFLAAGVDVNVIGYKNFINQPHKYESIVVGDVYYTRPFGTVVQVVRNETTYKSEVIGGDKYYRHTQVTPEAEWTVIHNLSKHPAVTVTDEAGKQVEAVVTYLSATNLKINFSVPRTGYAECN
jgi:hypothetical protein